MEGAGAVAALVAPVVAVVVVELAVADVRLAMVVVVVSEEVDKATVVAVFDAVEEKVKGKDE